MQEVRPSIPLASSSAGRCLAGIQSHNPMDLYLQQNSSSLLSPPTAQLSLLPPAALSGGRRQREHPSAHPRDASALSSDMTGDSVTPQPPHQLQGGDFSAN